MEGLSYITFRGYCSEGGVGVEGADVAVGGVDFTDVLREIPAIGIPCAVFLDAKRTRSGGLGGIPEDVPEGGLPGAREVAGGDLEVASVDVAMVKRYAAVGGYLLCRADPLVRCR